MLLALVALVVPGVSAAPCTTASDGLHDFTFCMDPLSWPAAAAACGALGAHLVDVEDSSENTWIWAEVSTIAPTLPWWLGLNDRAVEGSFAWDGGATSRYTDWRAGEPNDFGGNEDCARWPAAGGGVWADADCTLTQPYVCESGCVYESAYPDLDGDGFGDAAALVRGCGVPVGWISEGGDCDDGDFTVNPLAREVCGGGDDDCDGLVDEADPDWDTSTGFTIWLDGDGDGVGEGGTTLACSVWPGYSAVDGDCNDRDPETYPGAPDTTGDGIDQDCDGADDCLATTDGIHDFVFCGDARTWADAATACVALGAHLADVEDAAENDWLWAQIQALSPTVPWWMGLNDAAAEGDFVWDGGATSTYTNWRVGEPNDYNANEDCARWIVGGSGVWADADCTIAQPFVCEAGCLLQSAYEDLDGDGFGDDASLTRTCTVPVGWIGVGGDCDDGSADVNPLAVEVCGGGDDDCDGLIDEADPDWDGADGLLAYVDGDGDGVGAGDPVTRCTIPAGYAAVDGDCNDRDAEVYAGAPDAPGDGVDQDCDGRDACLSVSDGLHDFAFCTGNLSWQDAADACAVLGAHLADVEDSVENAWIWTQAEGVAPSANWWFGLDDRDVEGTFVWEGGATSRYTDWRAGEPNDFGGNEDCARWPAGGAGEWTDADCAVAQPYVCESGCLWESGYLDLDGDGYGDVASEVRGCGIPDGWIGTGGDCDDGDAAVHVGATEVCGGGDDDCDGLVDDADPEWDTTTGVTVWVDGDLDGFGAGDAQLRCAIDAGTSGVDGDCDDTNAALWPGATDIPGDGIDQDCDGVDACLYGRDADGDGYGDPAAPAPGCVPTEGYVANGLDCDDGDPARNPDAEEVWYDGIDQDCDGADDYDQDADGVVDPSGGGADCDDTRAASFPGAPELCDGRDNDCDGTIDDPNVDKSGAAVPACGACVVRANGPHTYLFCPDTTDWFAAAQACVDRGYHLADAVDPLENGWIYAVSHARSPALGAWLGLSDTVAEGTFAWESGAAVDWTAWKSGEPNAYTATEDCVRYADDDVGAWNDAECGQLRPYVCEVGCDVTLTYPDADGDTFGDAAAPLQECTPGAGRVVSGGDCDDGDAEVSPAAVEVCDGGDEDCDGLVDDADPDVDPASQSAWYLDADGDGYGYDDALRLACVEPAGYSAVGGDCDDVDATVHPGAAEAPNERDDDCNGYTEIQDSDGDGLTDLVELALGCDPNSGDGDGDGLGDVAEAGVSAGKASDADGDGVPDCMDPDRVGACGCASGDWRGGAWGVILGVGLLARRRKPVGRG